MSMAILSDPKLFVTLFQIDSELAEKARADRCPCGGRLDVSDYPRKPRAPGDLGAEHRRRHSFSCAVCRRRTTPPSVRFFARRVYAFPVVVLVTALSTGLSGSRLATLRAEFGVDRRTLERWRLWWREVFPQTRFWKTARARFSPPVDGAQLDAVGERFAEGLDGLVLLLRFLSPMSCASQAL
jgi:hypothetical protein